MDALNMNQAINQEWAMRSDTPIGFETFYFLELLNRIRQAAPSILDEARRQNLEQLLHQLQGQATAFEGVEKLAQHQLTSDLSIFFGDVLENLKQNSLETSLARLDEYARQFVEMFTEFGSEVDWPALLAGEPAEPTSAPAGHQPADQPVSLAEFCQLLVEERATQKAQSLPAGKAALFTRSLKVALGQPELRATVLENLPETEQQRLSELLEAVSARPRAIDSLENFFRNFEGQIEQLLDNWQALLKHREPVLQQLLSKAEAEEAAQPMEALFEETEPAEEAAEVGGGEAETRASELEDYVSRIEQELQQNRLQIEPLSEEERRRKKLLRDYFLHELEELFQEIRHQLKQVVDNPGDQDARQRLQERLKEFKEMGQIHGYPGTVVVADHLIRLVRQEMDSESPWPPSLLTQVSDLFSLIPGYVDATLDSREADHVARINQKLAELQATLLGGEPLVGLEDLHTLREAYQHIAGRFAEKLHRFLEQAPPAQWEESTLAQVATILNNLHYWDRLLQLEPANQAINLLKELLLSELRQHLTAENLQVLREVFQSWKEQFAHLSEEGWKGMVARLEELRKEHQKVGLAEAAQAVLEVLQRRILQLSERIAQQPPASLDNLLGQLTGIAAQIQFNGRMLGRSDLEQLGENMVSLLTTRGPEQPDLPLVEAIQELLQEWLNQLAAALPEELSQQQEEALLSQLQQRLSVPLPQEPTLEEPGELISEPAEAEPELETVFAEEVQQNLERLKEALSELRSDPENPEKLEKVGVLVHTIHGSAQMLQHPEVVELAGPLEHLLERVQQSGRPVTEPLAALVEKACQAIEQRLQNPDLDVSEIVAALESWAPQEEQIEAPAPKSEQAETVPQKEAEAGEELFRLREQDAELLNIFTEEVANNFDLVERHLTNLEKFGYDKEAIQDVDRSIHEIRSAAKMLGLTEIGELTDKMEALVEQLLRQQVAQVKPAIGVLRRAMFVVRELTVRRAVQQSLYGEVEEQLARAIAGELEPAPAVDADTEAPAVSVEPEQPSPAEEASPIKISPEVLDLFAQEAQEYLEDINYLLLNLEKDPENEEFQHHLMRTMHTLKGSAGMVQCKTIETLAHRCEDILEQMIQSKEIMQPDLFDVFFAVVDEIQHLVETVRSEGVEKPLKAAEIVQQLDAILAGKVKSELPEIEEAAPRVEAAPSVSPMRQSETTVRLSLEQMNRLLNLAAEILIGHTQFKNQLERLKNFLPLLTTDLKNFREIRERLGGVVRSLDENKETLLQQAELDPGLRESLKNQFENLTQVKAGLEKLEQEFSSFHASLKESSKGYEESLQRLNKLSNEMLDEIMQARLVPINLLFQRFHRPVRDQARQAGKKVKLVIKGENTEIDRTLLEELYEPLLHLIRNAIDHGIEPPEKRVAAGKPAEGTIELKANRDRNQIQIEIHDDGRGIDVAAVRQTILKKQLLPEHELNRLSESEVLDYLFYPGFSTAEETTLVSGRGVGLDAVRSQIEKLKGDLRLSTTAGQGTSFIIRVPISLSVIQSMLVEANGYVYSIPLMHVEETLNVGVADLIERDSGYYFRFRGKLVPVIQLSHLLQVKGSRPNPITHGVKYPVIVVQDDGQRLGLLVDKIVRREEVLIKTLGASLRRLRYVAGGSIMADGQVVLVVDIPQIIQDALRLEEKGQQGEKGLLSLASLDIGSPTKAEKKRSRKHISGRKPRALVVDDSLSIRKYVSSLLFQKGFEVESARNGYEALDLLKSKPFDIVVTDLEMPKLSGYELIEALRADATFDQLPIIVLSGRAGENFRQLTAELGADAYVIKPFKDKELFDQIDRFIDVR
ncbi:MAG: response regulator [Calditrichaeota bacterium]|nr:MAG: response regulator [Calditrichota bacterium]